MSDYTDQEIDLRPYIEAIVGNWYWILGLGLLAVVVAYVAALLFLAPTYEATALVAITEPRQRVQFDPRIETLSETQPLKAFPELARSDELLREVIRQLPEDSGLTLSGLRGKFEAAPGTDPSILNLTVSDGNPQMAAEMANIWAKSFVTWANQVYGDQGDEQLLFFEAQMVEAANKLELAEQALIAFQAHNRSSILENKFLALQQTQADYLAKQRQTSLILQDIESLLAHEGSSVSGQASIEQLASLLLQIRALGGVPSQTESTVPWQIQLNVDGQSTVTQQERREIISSLNEMLQAQANQIEERLAELEPQLLAIQEEKQEANTEANRLGRDLLVAEETYTALARAVDEKRITSQDTSSGVRLASETAVPETPTGPRKAMLAAGAGFTGMVLATTMIVLITWWRRD